MKRFNYADRWDICEFDGYVERPLWNADENSSTYYDYVVDSQCSVPGPSPNEVLEKLGML